MADDYMLKAEYFPAIPREEIIPLCKHTLPLSDISALGGGFAVAAAAIAKAAIAAPEAEGLYRCVFPEGVTGELAQFKDGSGLLGTIMNHGDFVGQARWIPAESGSVVMGVDPVTLAIAAAMVSITKRLDDIKETQEEIAAFLRDDKETKLEGIVNSLSGIMADYQFNNDNERWLGSQLTIISAAKVAAEQNINFYRRQVTHALEIKRAFHGGSKVSELSKQLQHSFRYYQMGVYLFAFANFLEVVLGGNHTKANLDHVSEKISEYSFQYRQDYSDCYEQLERYSQSSMRSKVIEGAGKAGKLMGNAIASIPVISKDPVDEALLAAGDKLDQLNEKMSDQVMEKFRQNRDAGIYLFQESIATINELCNQPVEILFDRNKLYICA